MSLELYFHPLSSFCQKVLVALYENETPFVPHVVDLGEEASSAPLRKLWPVAKIPVLRDEARDWTVPESSTIIEYLAQHYPGRTKLVSGDPDVARQTRFLDRFYDLHVNVPMAKVVTDRLRLEGQHDFFGVEQAKAALLRTAYGLVDQAMASKTWAMGDVFTMADCAAAPALLYANKVVPFGGARNAAAYLARLRERPSFARALREAEPYLKQFPE